MSYGIKSVTMLLIRQTQSIFSSSRVFGQQSTIISVAKIEIFVIGKLQGRDAPSFCVIAEWVVVK